MGRTFSLATLLLLTTFIAGWLGLLRIAPELAVIFAFISILAFARISRAVRLYAQAHLPLSRTDQITLFLSSQSVVIACMLAPAASGLVALSILGAALDIDHGEWLGFSLSIALGTSIVAFVATAWWLVPTRAKPSPLRQLALATGPPVGFYTFCAVVLYGGWRQTTMLVLLPRLLTACIVVPALIRTLHRITTRRRTGQPVTVKDVARSSLSNIASMAGIAMTAATCSYVVWILFYCLSAHDQQRSPLFIQAWCGLCELLAPASAAAVAGMVTIYLLQNGFTTGLSKIALALDLKSP